MAVILHHSGTGLMAKLTAALRFFTALKKMSEDANWRGVKIILSGAEAPGNIEQNLIMVLIQDNVFMVLMLIRLGI